MKKLKLQAQMTVDGFVAGPEGELDWMTWNWDDDLNKYLNDLTDSVDTILLGRKMTDGFISYWSNVKPDSEEYPFARKMVEKPKVVFTKTLVKSVWDNTTLAKGELIEEVNNLKKQKGKDIIVYGGAGFVSSLVQNNLIDEYNLFVNPAVLGKGMTIFGGIQNKSDMLLLSSKTFKCGIVLNQYQRK
jgi:dihydrofolate reductase